MPLYHRMLCIFFFTALSVAMWAVIALIIWRVVAWFSSD